MRIYIGAIIVLLFIFCVSAENETICDVGIAQYIDEQIYCNVPYDNLFRIYNDIYKITGEKVIVLVNYTIVQGNVSFLGGFNKTINSYSRSDTGTYTFACFDSPATICGTIDVLQTGSGLSVIDNNSMNNHVCFNLSILDPLVENCSVHMNFSLESSVLNQTRQRLFFDISNDTYPYNIEYWIEDVWGNVVKKPYNSSNTNAKSFTPNVPQKLGFMGYVAKARLSYIACNNSVEPSVISLPFFALGTLPDKTSFVLSSQKREYPQGQSIRIRLEGYKHDTGKTALYIKFYDKHGKKTADGATYYIPEKNSWFNFEFKHIIPKCSDINSPITIVAEGLDYKTELDLDIIPACDKIEEEDVVVDAVINESYRLYIHSFYTLQKTVVPSINLFSYIEGNGDISLRLYGVDDGFEKYFVEHIEGRKRIKVDVPFLLKENESQQRMIRRHYILTASDAYGHLDFVTLHINLSYNPQLVEPVIDNTVNNTLIQNKSSGVDMLMGAVVAETLYEDKGFTAIRFTPLLLLAAQLAFVIKSRKLMP